MRSHPIFAGTKTWNRRDPNLPLTAQAKWNRANAEKLKAHAAVRQALRNGMLKRGKCADCGSLRTEAHHEDYANALAVIWLCRAHHRRRHADARRATT